MKTIFYSFDVYVGDKAKLEAPNYKETCEYIGKYGMKVPEFKNNVCDALPDNAELYDKQPNGVKPLLLHKGRYQWVNILKGDGVKFGKLNGQIMKPIFSQCVDSWEDLSTLAIVADPNDTITKPFYTNDKVFNYHVNVLKSTKARFGYNEGFSYRMNCGDSYVIITNTDADRAAQGAVTIADFYKKDAFIGTVENVIGFTSTNRYNKALHGRICYMFAHSGTEKGKITNNSKIHVFAYRYSSFQATTDADDPMEIAGDIIENFPDEQAILLEWFKTLKQMKVSSKAITEETTFQINGKRETVPLTFSTYSDHTIENILNNSEIQKVIENADLHGFRVNLNKIQVSELPSYTNTIKTYTRSGTLIDDFGGYSGKEGALINQANNAKLSTLVSNNLGFGSLTTFMNVGNHGKVENVDTYGTYDQNIYFNEKDFINFKYPFAPFIAAEAGIDVNIYQYVLRHNAIDGVVAISEFTDIFKFMPINLKTNTSFQLISESGQIMDSTFIIWLWLANMSPKEYFDDKRIPPRPEPQPGGGGNPYEPGGNSGTGGGGGNFDETSDIIPIPPKPSTIINGGMVQVHQLSLKSLNQLGGFMWENDDFFTNLKKLNQNPSDVIISIHSLPANVGGNDHQIYLGNIASGVNAQLLSEQYVDISLGEVVLDEFWGSFMDYAPNTKIKIFLPYIGTQTLDPDVLMKSTVGLTYRFDILSGDCVAFITANGSLVYQFTGNASREIPFSSSRYTSILGAFAGESAGVVGTIGGAISGVSGGAITGGLPGAIIGGAVGAIGGASNSVMQNKPDVSLSSSMRGACGTMGSFTPYLFIERPRQIVPKDLPIINGLPYYGSGRIGDFKGFTKFSSVNLDNIEGATMEEIEEIKIKLMNGVIL